MTNSTFLENSDASLGGGGAIRGPLFSGTAVPPVTVTNSTFVGNYSQGQGGAISVQDLLTVTGSTFSNNRSDTGGAAIAGCFVTGCLVRLTNTIVADSLGTRGLYGRFGSSDHNLIDDDNSGVSIFSGTGNIINQPALLGTLGDYGGVTQTAPLLPGSPAIDAGAAVGSGPAGATAPAADQRVSRVSGRRTSGRSSRGASR